MDFDANDTGIRPTDDTRLDEIRRQKPLKQGKYIFNQTWVS